MNKRKIKLWNIYIRQWIWSYGPPKKHNKTITNSFSKFNNKSFQSSSFSSFKKKFRNKIKYIDVKNYVLLKNKKNGFF